MQLDALREYLKNTNPEQIDSGMLGYIANLTEVAKVAPLVAQTIVRELIDQHQNLKLIASENFSSLATQLAMGNLLTDKYAEGYPGHRFYAGCDNIDAVEAYACEQACTLFGCEHAYVQPHSGADANLIAYWAILNTKIELPVLAGLNVTDPNKLNRDDWNQLRRQLGNQRLLGMDYYSGGHLTHGYRHNVSAQMFDAYNYSVNPETGLLDYDAIAAQAEEIKPLILLAGYSAYPRLVNFRKMREIADRVGAVLMVDMAHFAGLVAAKVWEDDYNPVRHAQVVTTTTHKTLRGPRGGLVLCTKEFAEAVDKGCPLVIGGPLPQVIAAKAIALTEANRQDFQSYGRKIIANAKAMAAACIAAGMKVATGGTDNHLFLINVAATYGLTGRQAESALRECGVTLNRNSLPSDPNGPWYTSGLRIGAPAVTTIGMGDAEMGEIVAIIALVLANTKPAVVASGQRAGELSKAKYTLAPEVKTVARERVRQLLSRFPIYPQLDLAFLQKHFG
ncbi:MAG: glycine hydroxymethyltransferase [Bacillota bacterium]|jgi:glycine hydroxymethyltransferase